MILAAVGTVNDGAVMLQESGEVVVPGRRLWFESKHRFCVTTGVSFAGVVPVPLMTVQVDPAATGLPPDQVFGPFVALAARIESQTLFAVFIKVTDMETAPPMSVPTGRRSEWS